VGPLPGRLIGGSTPPRGVRGADYPFGAPAGPGLLRADGRWVEGMPRSEWPGRTAVVAVGSNGVPSVVQAKLHAAGVAGDVPFLPCVLRGLHVAHSAHVSPGGYVPTTAFAVPPAEPLAEPPAEPSAELALVLSWFTDRQLAVLDATEPNYRRLPLPAGCAPGPEVGGAQVYVSRWGVLAPAGKPVPPTTQAAIHRLLATDRRLRALLPLGDTEATVAALRNPDLAGRVRSRFAALGWVAPPGIG
jgi:hypothetical protein